MGGSLPIVGVCVYILKSESLVLCYSRFSCQVIVVQFQMGVPPWGQGLNFRLEVSRSMGCLGLDSGFISFGLEAYQFMC